MRENWLSNRIFKTYDDIVALCCEAWNKLIDQPWKIMSIGRSKMGPWVLINARVGIRSTFERPRVRRRDGGEVTAYRVEEAALSEDLLPHSGRST